MTTIAKPLIAAAPASYVGVQAAGYVAGYNECATEINAQLESVNTLLAAVMTSETAMSDPAVAAAVAALNNGN